MRGILLLATVLTLLAGLARSQEPERGEPDAKEAALNSARALVARADEQQEQGKLDEAAKTYRSAIAVFDQSGIETAELAWTLDALGFCLLEQGRLKQAGFAFERTLAVSRRLFEGDHPEVALSLGNLAMVYDELVRLTDALRLYEEALAMYRRLHDGDHEDVALSLNNLGMSYDSLGRHTEALAVQEEALVMCRRLFEDDRPEIAICLANLATTCCALGRYAEAVPLEKEALAIHRGLFTGDNEDIAWSISNLAYTYGALGRPADALPLEEEALAMRRRLFEEDHPDIAASLGNLAATYDDLGRPADALPLEKEALAMLRRLHGHDHPDIATGLGNLAATCDSLGRHADALPLHEEALDMRRRLFEGDHPDLANSISNVGAAYVVLGRNADALPLQEEAVAMIMRLFEGDHPYIATALNNLAFTYGELGLPAEALPLNEEALAMRRRLFEGDHPATATSLDNLALTFRDLRRYADALPLLDEALAMRRRLFEGDHPEIALSLGNLAFLHGDLGRDADALPLHEAALAMRRRLFEGDHPDTASCLSGLAGAYHALGRHRDAVGAWREAAAMGRAVGWPALHLPIVHLAECALEEEDAEAAIPLLEEAIAHLEFRRRDARSLGAEGAARQAAEMQSGSDPYSLMVEAHLESGRPERALGYLERGRARAMLDLLARGSADPVTRAVERARARGDEKALAVIEEARREVEDAQAILVQRSMVAERARAAGERREIRRAVGAENDARREVSKEMRRRLYAVREALPEARPLAPGEIRALLGPDERMLVYGFGARRSFLFLVGPEEVGAYEISGLTEDAVSGYAEALARQGGATKGAARALFDVLVPPKAWEEVRTAARVYVLPHGVLHRLPFEALVVDDAGRYWVDRGPPIAYAASGSVLAWLRDRRTPEKELSLVALGDPAFGDEAPARLRASATLRGKLAPLPGTRREVERIAAAFRATDEEARVVSLLGADATEERLFVAAGGARFLHLATHGVVDERTGASFSGLALTMPGSPAPGDDGFLSLADLLTRWQGRLAETEMVVLSACESQRGRLEKDEGMLSLPWGFCFAGAKTVVGSLWKVDDESTSILMAEFYRRLLETGGPGKAKALQEARRALRETHPDPYHWAPFVLLGDPR